MAFWGPKEHGVHGACALATKTLPVQWTAIVVKLAAATAVPVKAGATARSTQDRPVGSAVKSTAWHVANRTWSYWSVSWGMNTWWVTGLTSMLPMIPSLQGAEMALPGANVMP